MPATQLERAWSRIAHQGDVAAQQWSLRNSVLVRAACPDLVDLRSTPLGASFAWRDQYRGRSHVRPALARVFGEAMQKFRAEFPDAVVSLGDLAQPGCGQIAYGTLVRMVRDQTGQDGEATRLLGQARPLLGVPTVVEWKLGRDFPLENDRFRTGQERVLVENRLVGAGRDNAGVRVVRVATRRYAESVEQKPRRWQRSVKKMLKDVKSLWQRGRVVRQERVATTLDDGSAATRWLVHRVDPGRKRQLVVVATSRPGNAMALGDVEELRVAKWQQHKPDSYRSEVRWRPLWTEGRAAWRRWKVLIEADHVSHMTGRDADLAFVMRDNRKLHKVALRDLDGPATWRWFQLLVQTGAELGTPVERILVSKSIRRTLLRQLGKDIRKTELWTDVLVDAKGHDDHFHLRLTDPSVAADAQAATALDPAGQQVGHAL